MAISIQRFRNSAGHTCAISMRLLPSTKATSMTLDRPPMLRPSSTNSDWSVTWPACPTPKGGIARRRAAVHLPERFLFQPCGSTTARATAFIWPPTSAVSSLHRRTPKARCAPSRSSRPDDSQRRHVARGRWSSSRAADEMPERENDKPGYVEQGSDHQAVNTPWH